MQTLNVLDNRFSPFNTYSTLSTDTLVAETFTNTILDKHQVLALMTQLQTTLDIDELLNIFAIEATRYVDFSGLYFKSQNLNTVLRGSRKAKKEHIFELNIAGDIIGTLTYGINSPISLTNGKVLEQLHQCLVHPIKNSIAYHAAMQLAMQDSLTGLGNRRYFDEQLTRAMHNANRHHSLVGLVLGDLNKFKVINDTFGHLTGDLVLQEFAKVLRLCIRESDSLFRFGGDEFVVITDYSDNEDEIRNKAITFAKKLISITPIKKSYQNITIDISASIGIALYPNHGNTFTSLLSSADKAMYQVKKTGRNNYAMYHADIEQKRSRELQLISDMRIGLKEGQFTVHYQAKQSLKTNELMGCEALIRWQHPTIGNIPPLEFISIAEKSGLILPLGKLVLTQSCFFIKQWQAHSDKPLVVSVNVSALQLKDPLFKEEVLQAINDAGISGHNIELELTESLLMENIETTIETLHELKEIGISISIDDFGTGYSSLSYLQKLPVDTLKIDKSFVDSLSSSDEDTWIVINTISLASGLKLKTVAEGVETQEQKTILAALGCDILQGYLYSKPIPQDDFFLKFK